MKCKKKHNLSYQFDHTGFDINLLKITRYGVLDLPRGRTQFLFFNFYLLHGRLSVDSEYDRNINSKEMSKVLVIIIRILFLYAY